MIERKKVAEVAPAAKPPKIPKGTIILACCQCIGGKGQIVRFITGSGTGSVPWHVSGPGVSAPLAQTVTSNVNQYWNASLPPPNGFSPTAATAAPATRAAPIITR